MLFLRKAIAATTFVVVTLSIANAGLLDDAIRDARQSPVVTRPNTPEVNSKQILDFSNKSADVFIPVPRVDERPQEVPIEAFPWAAGLIFEGGYSCSGVIVATSWLVTAASCVDRSPESRLKIIAGTFSIKTPSQVYRVKSVNIHPLWQRTTIENDIAVVQIIGEFKKPSAAIALEGPSIEAQVGQIAQVIGWGATQLGNSVTENLQLIPTRILARSVCAGLANYAIGLRSGMFCAQSLLANYDVCSGFGGAGLVLNDTSGRRYLGGIVSWGEGCPPNEHKPTVYTDVLREAAWIRHVVQGNAQ